MANLDIIESEDLPGRARRVGGYLRERIRDSVADHPLVGDVRGVGLMLGVELVEHKATKRPFDLAKRIGPRVLRHMLAEDLIVRALPEGNTLSVSPPLVVSEAEVDEIVARFTRGLHKAALDLEVEGLWAPNRAP
jgi:L-2,4-diaminobutyrate transaminase